MPVLIEFFGVPGSGKTTLATLTARQCGLRTRSDLSASWNKQSAAKKFTQIFGSYLDVPCNAAAVRFAVKAKLRYPESIFRFGRLLAKRKWVTSQSDSLMLDQGFLQDLWSILCSARQSRPDMRALSDLIACLYKGIEPRILVLEVDAQCAARRISKRKHGDSRLDGLPEEVVSERLVSSAAILEAIIRAAQTTGLRIDKIDGSLPEAVLLRKIEAKIVSGNLSRAE